MKKSYSFTIIIGYRHRLDRLTNLRKVIDWALGFQGIEIIVVEQDSQEKLMVNNLKGFRHIFTKSNLPFNRSWAFNVGLKYASTNAIVFSDADVIMEPNDFIEALKKLQEFEAVNPAKEIIYLNPQESNFQFEQMKSIIKNESTSDDSFCRGMVMFRRDAIEKIGGWCEDFIGWGGEDDHQTSKVKQHLSNFECDFRCYHFFHQQEKKNDFYYQRNLQLLERLNSMTPDENIKYINNTKSKSGFKNKFADK